MERPTEIGAFCKAVAVVEWRFDCMYQNTFSYLNRDITRVLCDPFQSTHATHLAKAQERREGSSCIHKLTAPELNIIIMV